MADLIMTEQSISTKRIQALKDLKVSTELAHAELKARNQQREKKLKLEQRATLEEKNQLLEQGKNPYEVFRAREMEKSERAYKSKQEKILSETKERIYKEMENQQTEIKTDVKIYDSEVSPRYVAEFIKEKNIHHFTPSLVSPGKQRSNDANSVVYDDTEDNISSIQLEEIEKRSKFLMKQKKVEKLPTKQVIMGKGFGFLTDPDKIQFKDFDLGKTYVNTITLTNISYSFNSIKILPLLPKIKDFFSVDFSLPGRMSAGTSFTFTPKINEDISEGLTLLSETGSYSLPLLCLTKKCNIKVSPVTVNFGKVALGDSKTITVKISNEGAIPTNFSLDSLNSEEITFNYDEPLITGYTTKQVHVCFKPLTIGQTSSTCKIRFTEKSQPDLELLIQATTVDFPVYIEQSVIDFQTCYYNQLYRDTFVVHNRSATAHQFHIEIPPEYSSLLEIFPSSAYVQANSSSTIQIKLVPSNNNNNVENKEFILQVPLKIHIPNQNIPMALTIIARLTEPELSFSQTSIDFGQCYVNETAVAYIDVTNLSSLPQKFGFIHTKQELSIQPNDGFGTILPHETMKLAIMVTPKSATSHKINLNCHTLHKKYPLVCKYVGIKPYIVTSANSILFSPTCYDTLNARVIDIINLSKMTQYFDISVPTESQITVTPSSGIISRNDRSSILIQYNPHKSENIHWENTTKDIWKLPCVLKSESSQSNLLFLEVHTTVIPPLLNLSTKTLQFGTVPLGKSSVLSLNIENISQWTTQIKFYGTSQIFSISSPARPIIPGKSQDISVHFMPLSETEYADTLYIQCLYNNKKSSFYCISVVGHGVNPTLKIEPQDTLNMGVTMANETIKKSLKLYNPTAFTLTYSVQLKRDGSEKNYSRINPFTVSPSLVTIQAGEDKEVVVSFTPDHEAYNFSDSLLFETENNTEIKITKKLTGGCSGNKPYYIIANNRYDDSLKNEDKFSFSNLTQSTDKQSQNRHLLLVFKYNLSKREPSISTIEIGNLKIEKKGTSGSSILEYILEIPKSAEGFSLLDSNKGTLNSGQKKLITFQFQPHEDSVVQTQHKETIIKCTVNNKGSSDISTVYFTLVGYVT